jgi:hypothetical protein
MAETVVKDVVIWAKHIHGDPRVVAYVEALNGGQTTELIVEGFRGHWCKMADGRDGRRTPGLRPIGRMQDFWRELYATRRGDLVKVELAAEAIDAGSVTATELQRQAAIQALLTGYRQGSRSEGRTVTRDEMHER